MIIQIFLKLLENLNEWNQITKPRTRCSVWQTLRKFLNFQIFLRPYCSLVANAWKKSYCLHSALQATKANSCETTERLRSWSHLLGRIYVMPNIGSTVGNKLGMVFWRYKCHNKLLTKNLRHCVYIILKLELVWS